MREGVSTVATKRRGVVPAILLLLPLLIGIPAFTVWRHYSLPGPIVDLWNAEGLPQLSEHAILGHAKYLSEDIGYRTVGTREHALGDAWMLEKANELKKMCEDAVKAEPGRKLECEVWRQEGSGSHRFDILGKRVYKTYVNLSNIVLRVSDGTPRGKEHAVLVNSHVDSTIPSPGAADDALAVGVMLELARNLISTPGWEPMWSIIFLWNNAEESLQDGSHLFSTQHPIRHTVRAAINLEAAGTDGPEILFQATSQEMIEAYSTVPRPFGTIVANDIFTSGIIMSDTDFRQFELYLNTTGLDMAIIGHSYFYHTRKDLVEYIEPGAAQHMADNALALLTYLSSSKSPIPKLTAGYTPPTTVFFSFLGSLFFQYSFGTANALHLVVFISSVLFVAATHRPQRPSNITLGGTTKTVAVVNGEGNGAARMNGVIEKEVVVAAEGVDSVWMEYLKAIVSLSTSAVGSLLGVVSVALIMNNVIGRPLSWFSSETSCLVLYAPAALSGAFIPQALFRSVPPERTLLNSVLLVHSFLALSIQLLGVGSAGLFFLSSTPLLFSIVLERLAVGTRADGVWLGVYAIGQAMPFTMATEMFLAIADFFVPLTGRMGAEAPAEIIISLMVGVIGLIFAPLLVPFCHRFGRRFVVQAAVLSLASAMAMVAIFSYRSPYDEMHPKRLYVIHSENITTGEIHVRMAASDGASEFHHLVQDMATFIGGNETQLEATADDMHEYNADWDVLYPFSAFLAPYTITLPTHAPLAISNSSISVKAINDVVDLTAGTRSLRIVVSHPGVIWSTIAFDAHVLKWSLDDNPPAEHARHYIKEASFYGEDTWTVDLVISLVDSPSVASDPVNAAGSLQVNFVGIREKAMWPGKKAEKAEGGAAMELFERLDAFLEEHTEGAVDATLVGCVGGVSII